ncbi:hypothetical protein ACWNT8_00505 [Pigmentibacter ruber]
MDITVKQLLSKSYTVEEISLVDKNIANYLLCLEKENNHDEFINQCQIETVNAKICGSHRYDDWNNGWSGIGVYNNHETFKNIPYYFKKNTHIRIIDEVYKDLIGFSELYLLRAMQRIAFEKVLSKTNPQSIIEYGCGTGHNIQYVKSFTEGLNYYGADWTENACKSLVKNNIINENQVFQVDFFRKESYQSPKEPFLAYTNASLEQTGNNYKEFINYLFKNDLCIGGVHIEPMRELLDLSNPLNKNSFDYAEKRGYLSNFSEYIKNNSVEIIECCDKGIGSKYISGYQILTWKK